MTNFTDRLLSEELDDEQLSMAMRHEGRILILAPPGSGKTRVLVHSAAHRVRHARELRGYEHARVMCLTFGTDAAIEIRRRLQEAPLSVPSNRMWAGNYHSLAAYLLHRYGHLLGWARDAGVLPAPTNETVVSEAIAELGFENLRAPEAARKISEMKGKRQVRSERTLRLVRRRYDEILKERNLRDFDDLILHALELLCCHSNVRKLLHDAYPFVFVDELQDTSLLQLDLLSLLVGETTRVFAVADDDQMIYGWRDAYPENISEFVDRFGVEQLALVGNYRCPSNVVSAANGVIGLNRRRRDVYMESRAEALGGEVIILAAQTVWEGEVVADEVERAVAEGVPLGEIAILAPHRFKFPEVVKSLDMRGIRCVLAGGGEFRSNPIVQLLCLAFRCVAGGTIVPKDMSEIAFTELPELDLMKVHRAAAEASAGQPRALMNRLLGALGLGTVSRPNHDPNSIRLLARMARKAIHDENPTTSAELAEVLIRDWDRLERAALRAEDAVKVMTSYAAKGTEYDVVVLPFLNEGIVPYAPRGSSIDWEEARRLFYVALTRSKRRVVLIYDAAKAKSVLLETVTPYATAMGCR